MADTDPLPPEEIAEMSRSELQRACVARALKAGGSSDTLRGLLLNYWNENTAEADDEVGPPLEPDDPLLSPPDPLADLALATARQCLADLLSERGVPRFTGARKVVPFIFRALKATAPNGPHITDAVFMAYAGTAYAAAIAEQE